MNNRQLFLQHIAQTSSTPIGIEMVKAEGIYLYDVNGKKYMDAIAGFSVANIGHSNEKVIEAVKQQAEQYMHLIVYGEFIQQPQVAYAKLLTDNLPSTLNCVYFTNSGTEATEGAMKLAKRITNRSKIIAFNKSYHGSTQGALSVMGDEYWRNAYRPLLPDIYHFDFNSEEAINAIDENTACIIMEIVQAEAGIIQPNKNWLQRIRKKCNDVCALVIADEIQSGFGRTGTLFAFEQYGIVPDILLLGKALGGGMPLGAFIADKKLMNALTNNPVLGHITTFGGHPVSCAAGKAALEFLVKGNFINIVKEKEVILQEQLQHKKIRAVRTGGLWAAVEFDSFETNHAVIQKCIANGVITDWFLFAANCLRVAPPLTITNEELITLCAVIKQSIDEVLN
ncbi:MAG: aspartate aminotransferase family protein [Chitinophaga sp.]|jgi:acetylornithine/succinyldiaminopimelate/putrescine aminotransferase|nr:aspartate aminotransferase family protein [Chitinophaga sp.]